MATWIEQLADSMGIQNPLCLLHKLKPAHLTPSLTLAASMTSFQSSSLYRSEFDSPEAGDLSTEDNLSFSEQILDISMTLVESEAQPDRVTNDVRWRGVAFVCVYPAIVSISVI